MLSINNILLKTMSFSSNKSKSFDDKPDAIKRSTSFALVKPKASGLHLELPLLCHPAVFVQQMLSA